MTNELLLRYPGGREKAVTLSYDDGQVHDRRLIEIMVKYGLKGTFNLNSNRLVQDGWTIDAKVAKEVYLDNGMEIAVHGLNHIHLKGASAQDITYEIMQDRINFEKLTGGIVRGMAYPFGDYNETVRNAVISCGIVYSRGVTSKDNFELPTDWLNYETTAHHTAPNLLELVDKFNSFKLRFWDRPRLFALWGHSYEFNNDNNWDLIEEFGKRIGNRDEYWYVTNMELYDYVKAYESLIKSADGKKVYNPTLTKLWLKRADKDLTIDPGQTIEL